MSETTDTPKVTTTDILHVVYFVLFFAAVAYSFYVENIVWAVIALFFFTVLDFVLKLILKKKDYQLAETAAGEPVIVKKQKISKTRWIGIIVGIVVFFALLFGFAVGALTENSGLGLIINAVPMFGLYIMTVILHKKWNLDEVATSSNRTSKKRYQWIDDFRGLVVLLLIIAGLTWILSPKLAEGYFQIGPTWLNHGWKFYEYPDEYADIITIIDIGQQILMFIVGFVGALSFYSHKKKEGKLGAILHIFRRFIGLMSLQVFIEGILNNDFSFDMTDWGSYAGMFWTDTFPNLAWGSICSLLLVAIFEKKPDLRFIISLCIMATFSVMYTIPEFHTWRWMRNGEEFFKVPWNTINHIAIAIAGTCTYDWYQWLKTDEKPELGWSKRILPVATLMFIGAYLVDFVEPAEHHDATTVIAMMAIGTSQFVLFIFYNFDKYGYKIIGLGDFGPNIMIMFLYTGLHDLWLDLFDFVWLYNHKAWALLIVGIIPILYQYMVAWVMKKWKVYMKF